VVEPVELLEVEVPPEFEPPVEAVVELLPPQADTASAATSAKAAASEPCQ
jgi:hypothetical protein